MTRVRTARLSTARRQACEVSELARMLGRVLASDPNHHAWDNEQFLRWCAERALLAAQSARAPGATHAAELDLAAGDVLRARVHAKRLGVTRLAGTPVWHTPDVPGTPAQVAASATAVRSAPAVDTSTLAVAAGDGHDLWDAPCVAWVDLPPDVPSGRYVVLRVRGDSMEPLIASEDLVLVRLGGPTRPETVVVARHPHDGYVCKRVRRIAPEGIELVSLAPDRPVLYLPPDERLIVGTVVRVWAE